MSPADAVRPAAGADTTKLGREPARPPGSRRIVDRYVHQCRARHGISQAFVSLTDVAAACTFDAALQQYGSR
ncbi:hypothetical protein [Burkholderia sp. IMCC1007]|uniref:hypothetical protein n=1 Tax=Burkholderia sp. IMCC1007 TaxID=3004104 RepID=UPI0022B4F8A0|nr:hypothetical protein [Burkholderia sp. IMCC1007]